MGTSAAPACANHIAAQHFPAIAATHRTVFTPAALEKH
jgi:hypothetical protein